MTLPNQSLILDLLEWVDLRPRTYTEALAAWRTSCPRLTIWEDANDAGFLLRHGRDSIEVSQEGRQFLETCRGGRP